MLKKLIRILLPIFLLIVGLAAGGGYFHLKLEKERAGFVEEIQKRERTASLLQDRYREQKAMEGQLKRAQARLETRNRELQAALEEAEAEKSGCMSDLKSARNEKENCFKKIESVQTQCSEESTKIADLERRIEKLTQEMTALNSAHQGEIEALNAEMDSQSADLNKSLRISERNLDRCENDNAKLYLVAEELLERYKTIGSGKAFMYSEQFTQIKKVELEHLLQEYRYKVEDLRRQKTE